MDKCLLIMYDAIMQQTSTHIPQAQLIYKDVLPSQSHFQCGKCGVILTCEQEQLMREKITGKFCDNKCLTKVEDYQVVLHKNYYHIVENLEKIKDYRWWHATYDNPKNIEFVTNKDMHVGQHNAIQQIVDDKLPWFNNDFYLYELQLKKDVKIFPYIIPDYGVDWKDIEQNLENTRYDVFVYVNAWEGVGELSLIAKRNSFTMTNMYDNIMPYDRFQL